MRYFNPFLFLYNVPKNALGIVLWLFWFLLIMVVTIGGMLLGNILIDAVVQLLSKPAFDFFFLFSRLAFLSALYLFGIAFVNIICLKLLYLFQGGHKKLFRSTLFKVILYTVVSTVVVAPVYFIYSKTTPVYLDFVGQILSLFLLIFVFQFYRASERKQLEQNEFRIRLVVVMIFFAAILRTILIVTGQVIFNESTITKAVNEQWNDLFPKDPKSIFEYILLVTNACITTPILEELYFRGVIFQRLTQRFNFLIGLVISALIFASVHTPNKVIFLFSFVTGLAFAIVYRRFKNIWYVIILHAAFNATPFILMSLGLI